MNYISKKQTSAIKGLSAIAIVFVHLVAMLDMEGPIRYIATLGNYFVALFFFYSGYGIIYQYKRKKGEYLVGFIARKIKKIFVPWLIFALMSPLYYALGAKSTAALPPAFKLQNILEQLGEWVPNGWFIFVILLFEFSFYIMARLFKQDTRKIIIGCIVIVGGYIACMRILHMGYWWYYRSHCFLMGMIWCEEEERLINMFRKHFRLWWTGIFSGVFVLSMCYFFSETSYIMVAVMLVLFVTLVQLTSMKINLEHPVLEWLGSISMGIYLIHGFVLGILRNSVIYIEENWIYALLSVVITVMIASLKSINFQKKERYGKEV